MCILSLASIPNLHASTRLPLSAFTPSLLDRAQLFPQLYQTRTSHIERTKFAAYSSCHQQSDGKASSWRRTHLPSKRNSFSLALRLSSFPGANPCFHSRSFNADFGSANATLYALARKELILVLTDRPEWTQAGWYACVFLRVVVEEKKSLVVCCKKVMRYIYLVEAKKKGILARC